MDGFFPQKLDALGAEPRAFWGSFAPNGSATPLTASNAGPPGLRAFTTAYTPTGLYTLTLPPGLSVVGTPIIQATVQALLADYFEVLTGAYVAATRSFTIQAKRAAAAFEPAAAATTRINWTINFNNSTGG